MKNIFEKIWIHNANKLELNLNELSSSSKSRDLGEENSENFQMIPIWNFQGRIKKNYSRVLELPSKSNRLQESLRTLIL